MFERWTERFAWHSSGSGSLVLSEQVIGPVDWHQVQTTWGDAFVVFRPGTALTLTASELSIVIEIDRPRELIGHDFNGRKVKFELRSRSNPVHHAALQDGWITYRARHCTFFAASVPAAYRFALVNLSLNHPPRARWQQDGIELSWSPVKGFGRAVSSLHTRDRISVTAYLSIGTNDQDKATEMAEIACQLASYARGCRIQWLHIEGLDSSGIPVAASIPNQKTSPFMAFPMIREESFWAFVRENWSKHERFLNEKRLHARRLLGILLNATSEEDFLETRGIKLATLMDALLTILEAKSKDALFGSRSMDKNFESELRKKVRALVEKHLVAIHPSDEAARALICEQVASRSTGILNPTFAEQIRNACIRLRIQVEESDLGFFVKSRNELVHEARFVCQKKPPSDWPYSTPEAEYFSMLRFVDRFVLRTIGYRGPYVDRSSGGEFAADEP